MKKEHSKKCNRERNQKYSKKCDPKQNKKYNKGSGQERKRNEAEKKHTVNTRALVLDMLLESESGQKYANVIVRETLAKYDYLTARERRLSNAFLKDVWSIGYSWIIC